MRGERGPAAAAAPHGASGEVQGLRGAEVQVAAGCGWCMSRGTLAAGLQGAARAAGLAALLNLLHAPFSQASIHTDPSHTRPHCAALRCAYTPHSIPHILPHPPATPCHSPLLHASPPLTAHRSPLTAHRSPSALCSSMHSRASASMWPASLLALPSTPRPTLTPRSRIFFTGQIPEARRRLE